MTIFNDSDVTASTADYLAAVDKFADHYGYIHDGFSVVGVGAYDECAAINPDMADDAKLLVGWDCYLFVADACTYAEYCAACADGTVSKYY